MIFVFGCVAIAAVFAAVGIRRATTAALRVKRRVATLSQSPILALPQDMQAYVARIEASVAAMAPLVARGRAAVDEIKRGLVALRMPQAILAIRTGVVSVRLLVSGR